VIVGGLGDGELHRLGEYRLVLPDGSPIPAAAQVIGRGQELDVINNRDWYRFDLDDVPS